MVVCLLYTVSHLFATSIFAQIKYFYRPCPNTAFEQGLPLTNVTAENEMWYNLW